MKSSKPILLAACALAALTGCASKAPEFQLKSNGLHSRQVALMPYNRQGITVAAGTTWYYGESSGVRAFPAEGGIVYVVTGEDNILSELTKQTQAEADKQAAPVVAKQDQIKEKIDREQDTGSILAPVPDHGAKAVPVSSTIAQAFTGSGTGRLNVTDSTPKPSVDQKPTNKMREVTEPAAIPAVQTALYCGGQATENGVPMDMAGKELLVRVHFKFNSTKSIYQSSEDRLLAAMVDKPDSHRLHIIGFTDDRGNDSVNGPISQKRARYLKERLREKWPDLFITTEGRGSCPRLTDNDTNKGRTMNRRAEVYIF